METFEKLGLGEEKLKILRVVVHVAELAATVSNIHIKGQRSRKTTEQGNFTPGCSSKCT